MFFSDLPRVERNLSQLVEAGQQLFAKTSRDLGGQEVKAAILLGSRGVDLPGIHQRLQSLSSSAAPGGPSAAAASPLDPLEPLRDTDIAGFLRSERENALLSVIEETRRDTFEQVERAHWEAASAEWEAAKRDVLQAMGAAAASSASSAQGGGDLRTEVSRLHESTLRHSVASSSAVGGGLSRSSLDAAEVAYAAEVSAYNAAVASAVSAGSAR